MLCQSCQKRTANVHYTQIMNNEKVEMYLCEQCAYEKGQISFGPAPSIIDFLSGFIVNNNNGIAPADEFQDSTCKICGMSFSDFRKTGKMGCSHCYQSCNDKMKPIIKRLHGNLEHTGKAPLKISKVLETTREIDKLKVLLGKAVQKEEYEKAAELRDKIKEIEGGEMQQNGGK